MPREINSDEKNKESKKKRRRKIPVFESSRD